MVECPISHNVKGVRGFLGLTGYYRKFVKGYGKITKPLTKLTKNDGFVWGPEALKAFEDLKKIMTKAPIFIFQNFLNLLKLSVTYLGKA